MLRRVLALLIVLILTIFPVSPSVGADAEKPLLNLYLWADMIPQDVIHEFQDQTGIQVIYDTYDSNDILETKLLTNHSAYDVVCPSIFPYLEAQIEAGVYRKLDASLRKLMSTLDSKILQTVKRADYNLEYIMPFVWGLTGFAFNTDAWDRIKGRLGEEVSPTRLRMLFDPKIVQHFHGCGVSLLDEAVDVFPFAMLMLGVDPNSHSLDDLYRAAQLIKDIRPFVTRFGMYQSSRELATGELCLVQGWASDLARVRDSAAKATPAIRLQVVIPQEGASLWIDGLGIPKSAPHPDNAHKFIKFLMQPRISAQISNHLGVATANKAALPLVEERLRKDPVIYPDDKDFSRFFVDQRMPRSFVQARSRYWLRIKAGLNVEEPAKL